MQEPLPQSKQPAKALNDAAVNTAAPILAPRDTPPQQATSAHTGTQTSEEGAASNGTSSAAAISPNRTSTQNGTVFVVGPLETKRGPSSTISGARVGSASVSNGSLTAAFSGTESSSTANEGASGRRTGENASDGLSDSSATSGPGICPSSTFLLCVPQSTFHIMVCLPADPQTHVSSQVSIITVCLRQMLWGLLQSSCMPCRQWGVKQGRKQSNPGIHPAAGESPRSAQGLHMGPGSGQRSQDRQAEGGQGADCRELRERAARALAGEGDHVKLFQCSVVVRPSAAWSACHCMSILGAHGYAHRHDDAIFTPPGCPVLCSPHHPSRCVGLPAAALCCLACMQALLAVTPQYSALCKCLYRNARHLCQHSPGASSGSFCDDDAWRAGPWWRRWSGARRMCLTGL